MLDVIILRSKYEGHKKEKNMKNRKYLVTGATGFLGGTICRQLIEQGESVRAFALPNDKATQFIPEDVEICEGALCDVKALERFFTVEEGIETIVLHIASIVTVAPDYNPVVMNVNVGGTKNIIKCCLEHKECQKLVYCSSTGAIPETKKAEYNSSFPSDSMVEYSHYGKNEG